mmetsp:Transcript_125806/g.367674  ORF Transcript_125806/g.367674 Transcript_125806/m.367674 type:complete len:253 (-) Transcript_125806:8-766(-)
MPRPSLFSASSLVPSAPGGSEARGRGGWHVSFSWATRRLSALREKMFGGRRTAVEHGGFRDIVYLEQDSELGEEDIFEAQARAIAREYHFAGFPGMPLYGSFDLTGNRGRSWDGSMQEPPDPGEAEQQPPALAEAIRSMLEDDLPAAGALLGEDGSEDEGLEDEPEPHLEIRRISRWRNAAGAAAGESSESCLTRCPAATRIESSPSSCSDTSATAEPGPQSCLSQPSGEDSAELCSKDPAGHPGPELTLLS